MLRSRPIALILISLLVPSAAVADWPSQGRFVLLGTDSFHLTRSVRILDLPSGDVLVQGVSVGGNVNGFDVQRISPFGEVAPGWPARGASLGIYMLSEWSAGITVDDAGLTWMETSAGLTQMGAHLVDTSGVLAPPGLGWPLSTLSLSTALYPAAFTPAPGGVYAYFHNRLQRLTRTGAVAAGWPATALATLDSNDIPCAAMGDGAGGVVIMRAIGPFAQHFDSNAVRHVGWPSAGLALTSDLSEPIAFVRSLPELWPSDASHFFAVWSATSTTGSPIQYVRVQRVGFDGTIDPTWPSNGLQAVSPDSITNMTALPDRSGGLYLLWYAHGVPRGTHIHSDGSYEPGTDGLGVPLVPGGASYVLPLWFLNSVLTYVPADVTSDGRLVFAWDDAAIARSIRVRWLRPDLTADPSEPADGRLIQPNERKTYVRAVHAAPDGGAYVAWECVGTDPAQNADIGEVWMTRLLPSPLAGVSPPAPRPTALALSAPRPNPARGAVAFDVTLPDGFPARLELLDIAGRVVRTQPLQGAGPHAVSFADLATLAPGLYFARATTRTAATSARVVVSR